MGFPRQIHIKMFDDTPNKMLNVLDLLMNNVTDFIGSLSVRSTIKLHSAVLVHELYRDIS